MKKKFSIINISLFLGLITIVWSCSKEFTIDESEQETKGWNSAKVKFNINCTDFDQGGGATRATTDSWQDGDVVYLLLAGKDGNKVQAYVRYDGAKGEWGEVMYEGYKSNLTCTTERVAEAYFFEGVNDIENQTLSLSSDKAVYACSEGTYIYPENGDMTVTANMKPITGRICFKGASDTSVKVGGIKTYSSFSRTTGEFTTSTESVSTTVNSDGCTPYIYCVFADVDSPTLTITHDNTYKTVFDASSTVLKPGKSGSIMLPTKEDHRGWKMYDNTFTIGDTNYATTTEGGGSFNVSARDSANKELGGISIETSSAPSIELFLNKPLGLQTDNDKGLGLYWTGATIKTFAPHPLPASNSDEIATTGWVRTFVNSLVSVSATAVTEETLKPGQMIFIPASNSLTKA